MEINKIYEGDALSLLKTFPEKIFNTCVTSPPYYGLRAYGTDPVIWDGDDGCEHKFTEEIKKGTTGGKNSKKVQIKGSDNFQIVSDSKHGFCVKCGAWRGELGSEPSPELYVKHIVDIFREVKRTLRDDGTIWVNLGDSYAGGGGASGHTSETKNMGRKTDVYGSVKSGGKTYGLKPKDLIGIPWMTAFALRADGWYLRQDIIWHKPNPMPESVTDRCTKSHEYIFLLSKSSQYYYDHETIKTEITDTTIKRLIQDTRFQEGSARVPGKTNGNMKAVGTLRKGYDHRGTGDKKLGSHTGNYAEDGSIIGGGMANKRSVWTVNTMPYKEAHFATFPETLVVDMIKAGCPEGGLVLDPFGGANTTGVVARKLNRNYVAVELNPKYIKIGQNREYEQIGLFL